MSIYLTEARRVVIELCRQVKAAEYFLHDKDFLSCLAEEIQVIESCDNAHAVFNIKESGDIQFYGIDTDTRSGWSPSMISIPIESVGMSTSEVDMQISTIKKQKQAQIAESCLDIELKLKKKELIEKLLKVNS